MDEMHELFKGWHYLWIIQRQCAIEYVSCGNLYMCMFQCYLCFNDNHSFRDLWWSNVTPRYTKSSTIYISFFQRVELRVRSSQRRQQTPTEASLRQQQLMNRIRHTEGVGDGSCHSQTCEDNELKQCHNWLHIDTNCLMFIHFLVLDKGVYMWPSMTAARLQDTNFGLKDLIQVKVIGAGHGRLRFSGEAVFGKRRW